MNRAIRIVVLLAMSVAACTTPSAQPTGSAAGNPTALNTPAAPEAALCAAVQAHATNTEVLSALDPATATVDALKAGAAAARSTLPALVVAFGASGLQSQFGSQFQEVESGALSGLLDAIERLPAAATPAEATDALAPFGWPEPLMSDQNALLADLEEAACTS